NEKAYRPRINPIYGLSAALVAFAVLAGGAALILTHNSNNRVAPPLSTDVITESSAALATLPPATEQKIATPIDPDNPYNLQIHENEYDLSINGFADVWGDDNSFNAMFETDGMYEFNVSGEYWITLTPLTKFPDAEDGVFDFDGGYGFGFHDYATYPEFASSLYDTWAPEIRGKFFWVVNVPSITHFLPGTEWEISVYKTESHENEAFWDEFWENFDNQPKVFSFSFTANYEPYETFMTEFEGDERDCGVFNLKSIALSQSSATFDFEVPETEPCTAPFCDCSERGDECFYNDNDEISSVSGKCVYARCDIDNCDAERCVYRHYFGYSPIDYEIKFKDGTIDGFSINSRKEWTDYSSFSSGHSNSGILRFEISKRDFDIKDVEAFIINGVEFKLKW
ncbi:MAG: hypothetical protein FWG33_04415, partial [Oscillospiraceae bacterium]|nr:hypothetical protein [Oscillospiraceae bacterium]